MAKKTSSKKIETRKFPVIGIGTSAGGIEALKQLFLELPTNIGMGFVVIQHLHPEYKSILSEIIGKSIKLKVKEIVNGMVIEPNNVYINPPNKLVEIKDYKLMLKKTDNNKPLLKIDHFFKSLAAEKKNESIGVILSGTGTDGTIGLGNIKAEGGITFCADKKSVKFDGMAQTAIDSGNVDFVGSIEKIAKELIRIKSHPFIAFKDPKSIEDIIPESDNELHQIFRLLKMNTGVDFSSYKSSTVKRRIIRRMVLSRFDNFKDYVEYLKSNKNEVKIVYNDLLINVTNFFRDKDVFDALANDIYPRLIKGRSFEEPLRIWVPGCSTGEEAYSIAITLIDFIAKKGKNFPIQIFATDISDSSIEKARMGIYPESISTDVPEEILKNFFKKVQGNFFQINKSVRDICLFAKHDLTKDPPFSRIDLISCRNLLIYLSPTLQKKVIPIFHYALKPKGTLLLGSSESIGEFAGLFKLLDKKHKLYEKKTSPQRVNLDFNFAGQNFEKLTEQQKAKITSTTGDIQKDIDKLILEKYSTPSVLINDSLEILQFRGNLSEFIQPSTGMASLNIYKMVDEEINLDLNTAIRRAKKEKKTVTAHSSFKLKGEKRSVVIEVVPIKKESPEYYFLILFRTIPEFETNVEAGKTELSGEEEGHVEILKKELLATREHLQTIIEERDVTNEELRSAIEEIQSSNEELQSTNEELETAKEELQSTNEELITVNEELETRNFELTHVNNDLTNLLSNVNIPIIMLGSDMKIRRFTSRAEKIWNMISSDIGRPFSDLNPNIEVPKLRKLIGEVLDTLEAKEFEVEDKEGRWYLMRIRPYKTIENKIDGVVITLIDIGDMKLSLDSEKAGRSLAEAVIEIINLPVMILGKSLSVKKVNSSFCKIFNIAKEDVEGENLFDINEGVWNEPELMEILQKVQQEEKEIVEKKIRLNFNGKEKILLINAKKLNIAGDFIIISLDKE